MDKLLFKGKFICFEKEVYGLFLIYYDPGTQNFEVQASAGISSFISTYSVETPGKKYMSIMEALIDDEEASIEKSREVRALIESNMELILKSYKDNLMVLEGALTNLFRNYLSSKVEISISTEKVDSFTIVDFEKIKEERDEEAKELEFRNKYKIPSGVNVVGCFAVLSPIKGKSIKEIKEGDLILCKIDDSDPLGKKIIESYKLYTEDQKLKPIVGKTFKRLQEDTEIVLVLQFARDIMGIAREDDAVKVSYVDREKIIAKKDIKDREKKEQENVTIKKEINKERLKNEFTIYIGVGVFIVIIAILFLIIF